MTIRELYSQYKILNDELFVLNKWIHDNYKYGEFESGKKMKEIIQIGDKANELEQQIYKLLSGKAYLLTNNTILVPFTYGDIEGIQEYELSDCDMVRIEVPKD